MGVSWTKEQEQVIALRDRNILVSAAAGSGKTAVLVERIISMITDQKNPIDVDELLVVTFTKAAAGEMKERVGAAIEQRLAMDGDNEHLQKQSAIVHQAQITTIDSFCAYVIRNYFYKIDLDPAYRMGDEGEMKLLRADVAAQVLEEAYEKKEENFLHFVECYSTGKTDEGIEDLILKLYEFSMSYPWPREWITSCQKDYFVNTKEDLEHTIWMQLLKEDVEKKVEAAIELVTNAIELSKALRGPSLYIPALEEDLTFLKLLKRASTYQEKQSLLQEQSFARLSGKKDEQTTPEAKERVKVLREQVKDIIKELKEQYFFQSLEEVFSTIVQAREPVLVLLTLALEFSDAFSKKKKEKNLLDFSDLEHFALEILVEHTKEGNTPTAAARELAGRFKEIMIDEYQDSNFVQETILNSISGQDKGSHNLFMVGDVKQSIYRFRLARPELFMQKLVSYTKEESDFQKIILHKNFRSRNEVLESVNYLFEQIMGTAVGGVEYDEEAALYEGASFPQEEEVSRESLRSEVLLVETDEEEWEAMETGETAKELEARAIASKIQNLVGTYTILDKRTGTYRKAKYSDCVILLRTMTGWAEVFGRILNAQGVPASVSSQTGYFSATEVVTVLNYLRICDNPRQDIPLTSVLHSPIGRFGAEELAEIKSEDTKRSMYDGLLAAKENPKVKQFLENFQKIREKVPYTPVHQVIEDILEETGYLHYAEAMPQGEKRKGNLEMLVEKAIAYESTSYRGVFHFIRYIEQLQKYKIDFGEANTVSENENTVRIMSIHKSKGLEFPIVFAAGLGKRFNQQDARSSLVLHPDLGIGADCVDPMLRTKAPTLLKKVIQKQTVLENLGEELRVLYVALTRAKEKLILTGTVARLDKKLNSYQNIAQREQTKLSYVMLEKGNCYWDWILPALIRQPESVPILIERISPLQFVVEEVKTQGNRQMQKEQLLHWDTTIVHDSKIKEEIEKRFTFCYPYSKEKEIPVKITVSDVKRQSIQQEESEVLYQEADIIPLIPNFMKEESEILKGAARGTAYHKVMECIKYNMPVSMENIKEQLWHLQERRALTKEMRDAIEETDIFAFVSSNLGVRIAKADKLQNFYREQPFVLGVPAGEVNSDWGEGETVLIQGIIDAFFYEEEEIVLVDYKTDQIPRGNPQILAERYGIQLDYYAKAVERMTGRKVKEKIIYSFTANAQVQID